MIEVFKFYVNQLLKLLNVLDSWEIFPGVSYLYFMIACLFIIFFIELIRFGIKYHTVRYYPDFDNSLRGGYVGRHSSEYVAKHGKTGLKLRKRS